MRKLKRVAWFFFAGCCCCAGLMLIGGERSQTGSTTYCPNFLYGQFGPSYVYACFQQGVDCMVPTLSFVGDGRLHETGECGTCPDPIVGTSHPLPADLPEPSLVPQPDPQFSGILR
jgi:hypothetical protein